MVIRWKKKFNEFPISGIFASSNIEEKEMNEEEEDESEMKTSFSL
jgi:hypothetical protein